jgi:hypothetical protein
MDASGIQVRGVAAWSKYQLYIQWENVTTPMSRDPVSTIPVIYCYTLQPLAATSKLPLKLMYMYMLCNFVGRGPDAMSSKPYVHLTAVYWWQFLVLHLTTISNPYSHITHTKPTINRISVSYSCMYFIFVYINSLYHVTLTIDMYL